MGELVLSGDELGKQNENDNANCRPEVSTTATKSDAMARWERFLPTMMVRVLLVEADDSTRQIIAALLRKCNYRVAAVPDGLQAWELLKGQPHNVDLILTEVDLPSISGFALLTLITEHEACKNIPVIMMSSQDSISTVYKCMMRGAADYLVKPIRRNELSNLWQHVWRRKASNASGPQDESVAQRKVEGTSENDAASNHSNGNTVCIQRNDENVDKGSDAQSSCTKPELEPESLDMEKIQELSQTKQVKSVPSDSRIQDDQVNGNLGHQLEMNRTETRDADAEMALCTGFNKSSEARETNNVSFNNHTREVIDLNGFVSESPNRNYQNSSSSNGTSKFDYIPTLDLTLRSNSGGFENLISGEKRTELGHSNSSAFSRYINKPLQPLGRALSSSFDQEKECGTKADNQISNIGNAFGYNSETPKSVLTLTTGQTNHSELTNYCPQQRVFPLPIPVKGVRVNNQCPSYGLSSSMVGQSSVAQQESSFFINNTFYQTNNNYDKTEHTDTYTSTNTNTNTDQAKHDQVHKLDSCEDQSTSSSFCNGNATHFANLGYASACGSNSNVDQISMVRTGLENRNEESYFSNIGSSSHRSIQREAALTKFRMKRKDRCFEKKVRYESRKKLAEQRPRVKGQFVRQTQTHPSLLTSDGNL